MRDILTGDLHLTDLPRDEYRWGLFPWLTQQVKKHKANRVVLMGDVCDIKDHHSEAFVNRLVDELSILACVAEVVWLPGNHDGIQEGRPFFRFAGHVKNLSVLTEPHMTDRVLFLPNTRDYKTAWKDLHHQFGLAHYIYCHQTFDGCLTENGTRMDGIPPSVFKGTSALIFSGDIHVPQIVSKKPRIEYVGSPYRIRFGDSFTPRLLLVEYSKGIHSQQDLHFPTVQKYLIEIEADDVLAVLKKRLARLNAKEKDQIKVRVSLQRSEYAEWPALRIAIRDMIEGGGMELFGPELHAAKEARAPEGKEGASERPGRASPGKQLRRYAKRAGLSPAMLKAGLALLEPGK